MQKPKASTVSIQGGLASFSHLAADSLYDAGELLHRDSFGRVFEDIDTGLADVGIVPIENSTYGSIYENYDNLSRHDCLIVAEAYVKVSLVLAGAPGSSLRSVREVHSHQVALDQIRGFRRRNSQFKFLPHDDTAGAAEMVRNSNDPTLACCASLQAAEANGLKIFKQPIEDNPRNFTRFFAVAKRPLPLPDLPAGKTTVCFELGSEAGSLYKTLRSFADRDLALSRIESRPIINTDWNYRFYLDILAGGEDESLVRALAEMKSYAKGGRIDVLGSYPSVNQPS